MSVKTLSINWPALFNAEPFRQGWIDYRLGMPCNHFLHEGVEPAIRAPMDAIYALGRAAAAEAETVPEIELPERKPFFSTQMRVFLAVLPEMHKEFKLSALRHFINPEQKNNVA